MGKFGRILGGFLIAAFSGITAAGCGNDTVFDPPQVLNITPDDGSIAVPVNANVVVTFNLPMDESTVEGAANFTLRKEFASSPLDGSLTYNSSTFTAVFDPTVNLEPETLYRVTLTREIRGENGQPLAREYTWAFQTGQSADLTAPAFAGAKAVEPADLGSTTVRLRWDPATDDRTALADMVYLIFMTTAAGGGNYQAPSYRTIAGAGDYLVTGLAPETTYYFVVLARDETGNVSETVAERSAATVDATAPQATTIRPLEGAVNVPVNTNVTVTFDEAMDAATVSASTVKLLDPADADVAGAVSYNPSTLTITFDPAADLMAGTTYLFTLTTGIQDAAGNPLEREFSYAFTTSPP